jgi:hypothetical protein
VLPGEDNRLAAFLFLKGFFDQQLKIGNGSHRIGNPSENVFEIGCFAEKLGMLVANRHQTNDWAFESEWRHDI